MIKDNKFLINIVHGMTRQQVFFLFWGLIAGFFCSLMIAYYRKNTRSNFRKDGAARKIRVDARRISNPNKEVATAGTKDMAKPD